jgi:hypothetical protein
MFSHWEIAEFLLKDSRIDPPKAGPQLWLFACTFGHIPLVHMLMEASWNKFCFLIKKDSKFDFNISSEHFAAACCHGHLDVVKFLLRHTKVDLAFGDNLALRSACENNRLDVVMVTKKNLTFSLPQELMKHNVDLATTDNYCIRIACHKGYVAMAKGKNLAHFPNIESPPCLQSRGSFHIKQLLHSHSFGEWLP